MLEFMVLSAPRSASTWVANWLTTSTSICLHDPVFEHHPEDLDVLEYPGRRVGIACTALALLPAWVNAHRAPKVIVHRNLDEVNASLVRIGLTALGEKWRTALDSVEGLHVDYDDLFFPRVGRDICAHLGLPWDWVRFGELTKMNVEPNFNRVTLRADRARAFRERVARAFQ